MEKFSHDLTLALEETSRSGGVRTGRWGLRRRTRSTGNLRKLRFRLQNCKNIANNILNEIGMLFETSTYLAILFQ